MAILLKDESDAEATVRSAFDTVRTALETVEGDVEGAYLMLDFVADYYDQFVDYVFRGSE